MKVKCTGYKKKERYFTKGKVYDWSEDKFINDDGFNYNSGRIKFAGGEDPSEWELSEWYNFEVVMENAKFKIGDRVVVVKEYCNKFPKCAGTVKKVYDPSGDCSVEFDKNIGGHSCGGRCKSGHGWLFKRECLKLVSDNKIVITADGRTTIARLYEDGKVVKEAEAKCSPSDTFDFETGAKLAFERLTAKPEYDYKKAKKIVGAIYEVIDKEKSPLHGFKIGEKITLIRDDGSDAPEFKGKKDTQFVSLESVKLVEEKPKYYNGKVVCVEKKADYYAYTVGKIYEFVNGRVEIDNGNTCPHRDPIYSLDEWNESGWAMAKFIELKE